MLLIGVDCATELRNVGAASAVATGARPQVHNIMNVSPRVLADRIRQARSAGQKVLLALDAPLGWPEPLGRSLVAHRAGEAIDKEADALFRRTTDICVRSVTEQTPLDVGANLIARTAHATLNRLRELRQYTGHSIPLAWQRDFSDTIACIEVYPAATLRAHELPYKSYKKKNRPEHAAMRQAIIKGLDSLLDLPTECRRALEASDHALDAAVCVLAAWDFIRGDAVSPENNELAQKEGWIWVRSSRGKSNATRSRSKV